MHMIFIRLFQEFHQGLIKEFLQTFLFSNMSRVSPRNTIRDFSRNFSRDPYKRDLFGKISRDSWRVSICLTSLRSSTLLKIIKELVQVFFQEFFQEFYQTSHWKFYQGFTQLLLYGFLIEEFTWYFTMCLSRKSPWIFSTGLFKNSSPNFAMVFCKDFSIPFSRDSICNSSKEFHENFSNFSNSFPGKNPPAFPSGIPPGVPLGFFQGFP